MRGMRKPEGEKISGWRIPTEQAEEFYRRYKEEYDPEGLEDYICRAEGNNENGLEIRFKFY